MRNDPQIEFKEQNAISEKSKGGVNIDEHLVKIKYRNFGNSKNKFGIKFLTHMKELIDLKNSGMKLREISKIIEIPSKNLYSFFK